MNREQSTRWRRRLTPYVLAAAAALILALGFRPSPVLVDVEPVTRGPLAVTVEEEGRTRVIDRYQVSAPIAAQARRITLDVGDAVQAGDVIAVLDARAVPALDARSTAEAHARVAAAEAALAVARQEAEAAAASARFARQEYERLRRLGQKGLAARSEVEQMEAEARRTAALQRSAEFRVQTATFELEAARTALLYAGGQDPDLTGVLDLRAPVSGQVLKRHFESARVVQPGEPILEIGDPTALEVEVDVLSSDAVRIAPGMRVLFERWGAPEPLEGRVRRVEPVGFTKISALGVEEQRVLVIADITSPREQWARLGDAYRVNARFVLWEGDDVLRVPTSALFRHDGGWAVFVVERGRAALRPLEPGHRSARMTEVMNGLEPGDTVVVHPDRDIAPGTRLRLRPAADGAGG
jgi:HlyD family secretion protein